MKKLSIEETIERYDMALETILEILNSGEDSIKMSRLKLRLQNVFPELKESEDDRIRKSLIDLVKCNERSGYTLLNNVSTSSMLAWLEKQNSNSIKWNKNTKDNKPQVNHSVLMQTIYGVAEGEWRGENWYQYRWAGIIKDTDVLFWIELYNIERQGEQKSHKEDRLFTDEQCSRMFENCKITKFKVGDFIVNDYCMGRVVRITDDAYLLDTEQGIPFSCQSTRLWDITKDAKEGDVLYCKGGNGIEYFVMNKGINIYGNIDSYFRYNSLNDFGVDIPSVLSTACDNITPATKEQREFLFKKMKEAGYEWDKEKKELKKIEQKTAWSEEDLKNEIANQYESFYEEYLLYEQFADIAKHFFDLGLKAQKEE